MGSKEDLIESKIESIIFKDNFHGKNMQKKAHQKLVPHPQKDGQYIQETLRERNTFRKIIKYPQKI